MIFLVCAVDLEDALMFSAQSIHLKSNNTLSLWFGINFDTFPDWPALCPSVCRLTMNLETDMLQRFAKPTCKILKLSLTPLGDPRLAPSTGNRNWHIDFLALITLKRSHRWHHWSWLGKFWWACAKSVISNVCLTSDWFCEFDLAIYGGHVFECCKSHTW